MSAKLLTLESWSDNQQSENYGITRIANDLFIDYFFGRKQSVFFGGEISQQEPVTCGVPRGPCFAFPDDV